MIILNEFVDFIEVIRINMFAIYAEVPFDRLDSAKSCALSAFVLATLSSWGSVE